MPAPIAKAYFIDIVKEAHDVAKNDGSEILSIPNPPLHDSWEAYATDRAHGINHEQDVESAFQHVLYQLRYSSR